MSTSFDISKTREFLAKKENYKRQKNYSLFIAAQKDFTRIVDMIIHDYQPYQIYQWGSLLHAEKFSAHSDIDIAIDSDIDAQHYFEMVKKAGKLSDFPLDILLFKDIHPLHLQIILQHGKQIYVK